MSKKQPYAAHRPRLAKCDLNQLARLNAECLESAYLAATGQCPQSKAEREAASDVRQHIKAQIHIDDARRNRFEVAHMEALVEEMRELKAWIEKHGSSAGFVAAPESTH